MSTNNICPEILKYVGIFALPFPTLYENQYFSAEIAKSQFALKNYINCSHCNLV
jgi:hypothetical protein